jgi:protein phosphatase 1 regulatory subunit 7
VAPAAAIFVCFLQVLDVSNNRISKVEYLQGLTQLQDLWLNDNQIPSLEGVEDALLDQKDSLTTIYLENNPAAAAPDYKQRILALFPGLIQLDADDLDVQHSNRQAGSKPDGMECS